MEIQEILKLTPEQLATTQLKELKLHVVTRLQKIIQNINNDQYDEVLSMTFESPAGDDMGMDNTCIDMAISDKLTDIGNVIDRMKELKGMTKKSINYY